MKRVERRGTLETQQLQNAAALQQHFPPRNASHLQPPSQGSIQRSDTLITNQGSLGPSSFNQLKTEKEEGSHQHSRTSTNNQGGSTSSTKNSSRHAPTPPAIASLREQDDDEDNEDPEQLPTSNVGRGLGSLGRAAHTKTAHSRPNSRNGRGNGNGNVAAKKSSLSTTSRPSVSPRTGDVDMDEMDADADADADAELLEAVDAAEAISNSSHGGDHPRLKTET